MTSPTGGPLPPIQYCKVGKCGERKLKMKYKGTVVFAQFCSRRRYRNRNNAGVFPRVRGNNGRA